LGIDNAFYASRPTARAYATQIQRVSVKRKCRLEQMEIRWNSKSLVWRQRMSTPVIIIEMCPAKGSAQVLQNLGRGFETCTDHSFSFVLLEVAVWPILVSSGPWVRAIA